MVYLSDVPLTATTICRQVAIPSVTFPDFWLA